MKKKSKIRMKPGYCGRWEFESSQLKIEFKSHKEALWCLYLLSLYFRMSHKLLLNLSLSLTKKTKQNFANYPFESLDQDFRQTCEYFLQEY